jgi:phosphopantothenoylcysteine decarboxylase/phosphopantothenate--cysteine ligase
VGFAAETMDIIENARKKLEEKHLDLIVANDVSQFDSGFATETNRVVVIDSQGNINHLPLMSKEEVANSILDRVLAMLKAQDRGRGRT